MFITSLIHWVMLVTLAVAFLVSLHCLFFIRHRVLGSIRISILDESCHQRSHVVTVTLEPPQLLLQRFETASFLQH